MSKYTKCEFNRRFILSEMSNTVSINFPYFILLGPDEKVFVKMDINQPIPKKSKEDLTMSQADRAFDAVFGHIENQDNNSENFDESVKDVLKEQQDEYDRLEEA